MKHKKWLIAVTVLVGAGLLGLSHWQWQRAKFKQAQQKVWQQQQQAAPLQQDDIIQVSQTHWLGRVVSLSGKFEPSKQLVWQNQWFHHQAGVAMLTPFRLDNGALLLVHRGWFAQAHEKVELARRHLHGVAIWPSRGLLLGENIATGAWPKTLQVWSFDEVNALYQHQLVPVLVREQQPHETMAALMPSQGLPPQQHQGYALQWFALACTWFVLMGRVLWQQKKAL